MPLRWKRWRCKAPRAGHQPHRSQPCRSRWWSSAQFNPHPHLGDAKTAFRSLCGGLMGFSCDAGLCSVQGQVLQPPHAMGDTVARSLTSHHTRGDRDAAFPSSSFSLDALKVFVLCSVVLKQDAGQLLIAYTPGKSTAMGGSVFTVVLCAFCRNAFHFPI